MKNAMVLGAGGGVGQSLLQELAVYKYCPIPVTRDDLDLTKQPMDLFLDKFTFDVIINCAGVFETDYHEVMAVNLEANYQILEYYRQKLLVDANTSASIVLMGSSAYQGPRRNYPLYAASKAALHSLVQSYQEIFENTRVSLSLLHPSKIRTAMGGNLDCQRCLEPQLVANALVNLIGRSTIINLEYTL